MTGRSLQSASGSWSSRADHQVLARPVDLIMVAGRRLRPTPVFETYWRFAAARQQVYLARLRGDPGPWTADPILAKYRFTNCYRAADRVSQYLIKEVIDNALTAWFPPKWGINVMDWAGSLGS